MRSIRAVLGAGCLGFALAAAACESTPSAPALFTTETFTGTVTKTAPRFHTFVTAQNAPIVIRMTAFTPATIQMGLGLGQPLTTPAGDECRITIGQAVVQQGSEFQVQLPPGPYCIIIFDAGQIPEGESVAYTSVVQHK